MKFTFENLGPIKKAEITLGDLTIISGKNNTGKSYLAYAMYGFLEGLLFDFLGTFECEKEVEKSPVNEIWRINVKKIRESMVNYFDSYSKLKSNTLFQLFNANEVVFGNSKVSCSGPNIKSTPDFGLIKKRFGYDIIVKDGVLKITSASREGIKVTLVNVFLFQAFWTNPPQISVILTSERTGIQLFQKELDSNKNDLINDLLRKGEGKTNPLEFLQEATARYSIPIQSNINFARDLLWNTNHNSEIYNESKEVVVEIEKMLGVKYHIAEEGVYLKTNDGNQTLPLHLGSTSTRALLGLYVVVRYLAEKDQVLIIDEPELNLHPENQIMLARVIAKLVNYGIKVIITTHSDYIVKEINNLIALSNDFEARKEVMEKFDYKENEVLKPSAVRAYIAENNTANEVKIDKFGMERTTFDEAIEKLNESSEDIAFGINE